jgi:hypothetical protein
MSTDHILALLMSERDKVTRAIEALQGPTARRGRPQGSGRKAVRPSVVQDSASIAPSTPAKRKLSAAGRRAIIAGTKKRWAAIKAAKAAKAAAVGPASTATKAAPAEAPAGSRNAAFRKKMSQRMKAAWAARKKKGLGEGR